MAHTNEFLTADEYARFTSSPVKCKKLRFKIKSLADYFAVISTLVSGDEIFWFRGHDNVKYTLIPSALRYGKSEERRKALNLLPEFKRVADIKIQRPALANEELKWVQIAQHNGLPTRLLDWSESATTALFFASLKSDADGLVFVLNPVDLNRLSYPDRPRVLDPHLDEKIIGAFLRLGPRKSLSGRNPIAINPVWNSERLMMQRGVFTLHGSRFEIDPLTVTSLIAIPVLKEMKLRLRSELQRVGIDEMTLFPELEHACNHLKRRAGLAGWD